VRVLVREGRTAQRSEAHSRKDWRAYAGRAMDQIHLASGDYGRTTLEDYLYEAIDLEESGTKIDLKKPSEYPIPEELQRRLDDNAVLRSAFATLTPGRRKSYIFHVSSAKQAKTRAARAEKCVPMILSGRGFNELPN